MLEDNREISRFPPIDYEEGKLGRILNYKQKELMKYFDLEKRWLATSHY